MLLVAVFTGDPSVISKAVHDVEYYIKRNSLAYRSHRKKKVSMQLADTGYPWG